MCSWKNKNDHHLPIKQMKLRFRTDGLKLVCHIYPYKRDYVILTLDYEIDYVNVTLSKNAANLTHHSRKHHLIASLHI